MGRLLSGRVGVTSYSGLSTHRNQTNGFPSFLGLNEAEPSLGLPSNNEFILYANTNGERFWQAPPSGGGRSGAGRRPSAVRDGAQKKARARGAPRPVSQSRVHLAHQGEVPVVVLGGIVGIFAGDDHVLRAGEDHVVVEGVEVHARAAHGLRAGAEGHAGHGPCQEHGAGDGQVLVPGVQGGGVVAGARVVDDLIDGVAQAGDAGHARQEALPHAADAGALHARHQLGPRRAAQDLIERVRGRGGHIQVDVDAPADVEEGVPEQVRLEGPGLQRAEGLHHVGSQVFLQKFLALLVVKVVILEIRVLHLPRPRCGGRVDGHVARLHEAARDVHLSVLAYLRIITPGTHNSEHPPSPRRRGAPLPPRRAGARPAARGGRRRRRHPLRLCAAAAAGPHSRFYSPSPAGRGPRAPPARGAGGSPGPARPRATRRAGARAHERNKGCRHTWGAAAPAARRRRRRAGQSTAGGTRGCRIACPGCWCASGG